MSSFNNRIILWTVVAFLSIQIGFSFVPEVCVSNVTSEEKICCPTPAGHHLPCGGPGRGICSHVYVHKDQVSSELLVDDRMHWPLRFFKKMCRCEGNYFGMACETCWYGWKGKRCSERHFRIRRNIHSLSERRRKQFMKILEISHDTPCEFMILEESSPLHSDPLTNPRFIRAKFQQFIAYVHRYTSRSTLFKTKDMCDAFGYLDFNHNTVSFATWHRALILYWENELGKIASREFGWDDFGVPYWDWIDADKCDVCTNNLMGATGKHDPINDIWLLDERSQFYNWTEYCSPPDYQSGCVGCHYRKKFPRLNRKYTYNNFPVTKDLIFTLRHSSYYVEDEKNSHSEHCRSFHIALEGFCGRPNDPGKSLYMHNRVHNMVHGSMCCASTASNDPLFILHHSQIDRIIECWFAIFCPSIEQLPNHGTEPGNCRESNIVGYLPIIKHAQMFTGMENLGIRYDNLHFGKKGFQCLKMIQYIRDNKF